MKFSMKIVILLVSFAPNSIVMENIFVNRITADNLVKNPSDLREKETIRDVNINSSVVTNDEILSNLTFKNNEELDQLKETNTTMKPDKKSVFPCYACDPPDCNNLRGCKNASKCYFSELKNTYGEIKYQGGCISSFDLHQRIFCSSSISKDLPGYEGTYYHVDCCDGDYCNSKSIAKLAKRGGLSANWIIITVIATVFVFICLVVGFIIFRCRTDRKRQGKLKIALKIQSGAPLLRDDVGSTSARGSVWKELVDDSVTSGSGSGLPLLVQRTVAKQIYLAEMIGRGRYGEVWRGVWQGENIAVKNFFSRDEGSWRRETEIYSTVLLRHENILGFIGSDVVSRGACAQLWLLTHYHPQGSLYDYLNSHTLNHTSMMKVLISILNGLLHLHYEIFGTQGKPAIAHRDLKSKNILMKDKDSCVIADFGLAVKWESSEDVIDVGDNSKVGTKRYMAPEVLNDRLDVTVFENFRKADMYSMALVMWEICQRCVSNGIVDPYMPPYGDVVQRDPSFEEMKKIVVADQYRPIIHNRWSNDAILSGLSKIIRECWHPNPNVRLTVLRVKKSLTKLAEEDAEVKANMDF